MSNYQTLVLNNLLVGLLFVRLISFFLEKELYSIAKEIIRWLIIGYATTGLLYLIVCLINNPASQQRATGPYWWAFWIMSFFSTIFPFVLLLKRLKHKVWAIFTILLLMNFGRGMNWLVTNGGSGSGWSVGFSLSPFLMFLGGGILAGLVITGISIVVLKSKKADSPQNINSK